MAFVDGDVAVTFAALAERASARAAAFSALGVRQRDRVALVVPAGLPFVEAFWALQLLGAVPCAFSPATPPETLERRVARVRPAFVLTAETLTGPPSQPRSILPSIEPSDLAFLQSTSGVSGEPRVAMITHANVRAFFASLDRAGHCRDGEIVVSWLPPWHDFGLVRFVIGSVYQASTCHLLEPAIRSIPAWLRTISEVEATMTAGPDFAYRLAPRFVDPATVDLSSLWMANNGAEPVRRTSIERFEQTFALDQVVVPGYGLAEVTLGVSGYPGGEPFSTDERGNVASGKPFPGIEVRAGTTFEEPAEILVRSEAVFAGYFEAPDDTAQALRDGWLHTGDSGYLDEDGNLYVLGRERAMIKRAGGVLAPRELEEVAERVKGVRIAAAAGVPADGVHGESVVVAVETRPGAREVEAAVSRAIVSAVGFAPERVCIVPRGWIPRTENGKVRHMRLRSVLARAQVA